MAATEPTRRTSRLQRCGMRAWVRESLCGWSANRFITGSLSATSHRMIRPRTPATIPHRPPVVETETHAQTFFVVVNRVDSVTERDFLQNAYTPPSAIDPPPTRPEIYA